MALFPTPESPTSTHFARSRRGIATMLLCFVVRCYYLVFFTTHDYVYNLIAANKMAAVRRRWRLS